MDKNEIRRKVIEFWDATSADYDNQPFHGVMSDEEEEEWMKFFKSIIPPDTKNILEVGCGTGFVSLHLAKLGFKVKGSDISEGMICQAKRKAKEQGLEEFTEFEVCDAQDTKEADESMDLVINRQMMWMLPEPEKALSDWVRVVKPGGRIIIIAGDGKRSKEDKTHNREKNEKEKKMPRKMMGMSGNKKAEWFSEELLSSLPMVRGDKTPEEFMTREDAELSVITLDDVQTAEDKALEKMTGERVKREPRNVYIITKRK